MNWKIVQILIKQGKSKIIDTTNILGPEFLRLFDGSPTTISGCTSYRNSIDGRIWQAILTKGRKGWKGGGGVLRDCKLTGEKICETPTYPQLRAGFLVDRQETFS
jgi:hypothetical protein